MKLIVPHCKKENQVQKEITFETKSKLFNSTVVCLMISNPKVISSFWSFEFFGESMFKDDNCMDNCLQLNQTFWFKNSIAIASKT